LAFRPKGSWKSTIRVCFGACGANKGLVSALIISSLLTAGIGFSAEGFMEEHQTSLFRSLPRVIGKARQHSGHSSSRVTLTILPLYFSAVGKQLDWSLPASKLIVSHFRRFDSVQLSTLKVGEKKQRTRKRFMPQLNDAADITEGISQARKLSTWVHEEATT
jgi:hypothetical protein